MKTTIEVDNIKCGGCRNSIHKKIGEIKGVFGVEIDMMSGKITIDHTDEVSVAQLEEKLHSMGYPKTGTTSGLDKFTTTAKSFVSCAIGRMSDKKEK